MALVMDWVVHAGIRCGFVIDLLFCLKFWFFREKLEQLDTCFFLECRVKVLRPADKTIHINMGISQNPFTADT